MLVRVDGSGMTSIFFVPSEPEARSSARTAPRVMPLPRVLGSGMTSTFFVPGEPDSRCSARTCSRVLVTLSGRLTDWARLAEAMGIRARAAKEIFRSADSEGEWKDAGRS